MEPEIQAEGVAALQPVEETSSLRMILTLGLAGMISGLALVGIYLFTAPIIEANKAEALRRAIFLVVPGSESYQTLELQDSGLVAIDPEQKKGNKGGERIYAAFDGAGDLLGFAIPGAEPGFQDLIQGIFGYRADERMIIGFEVLDSKETPGLGDKIIKDQHFRVVQNRLREADATFEAFRKRLDRLIQDTLEDNLFDHFIDTALAFDAIEPPDFGNKIQKPPRRHVAIGRRAFGQVSNAFLDRNRIVGNTKTAYLGETAGGFKKSCDHLHRRRFSGAVRPQESKHLTLSDVQADAIHSH